MSDAFSSMLAGVTQCATALIRREMPIHRRVKTRSCHVGKPTRDLIPVLFIPGVLGTTLLDPSVGNFPVWGSYKGVFLYRDSYEDLDLPILSSGSNRLVPGDVLWTFPVVPRVFSIPVYLEFANTLEMLGYRMTSCNRPVAHGLYGLSYDWRYGVLAGARAVEKAVNRLKAELSVPRVHLVSHSFGSCVARYYIRYGGADVLSRPAEIARPGADNIDTFYAVGAPFNGTLRALHEVNAGFSPAGALGRRVSAHHVATSVAAYELLRYEEDLLVDGSGHAVETNVDAVETWERFGWGVFDSEAREVLFSRNRLFQLDISRSQFDAELREFLRSRLARGYSLWRLLRSRDSADDAVRTIIYAASNNNTLLKGVVSETRKTPRVLFTDDAVVKYAPHLSKALIGPGDGYVPIDDVFAGSPGTPVVHDPSEVPNGNYVMLAASKGHRYLLQSDSILTNLAKHLAHASPASALNQFHEESSGVSL